MSLGNNAKELAEILKNYKFETFTYSFVSGAKERNIKMIASLEAAIYFSILVKLKDDFETLNFIISSLNLNSTEIDMYLFLLVDFYIDLDVKDKLTKFCCEKNLDITMKELLKRSKLNIKQLENYLKISKENSSDKIIDLLESE
ncbi:MAG TPA: hypothetical protein VN703_09240, partial [Candidatus Sulfopaludibacter sp.]|nr:hypothetical protein [Candidatus Sulfopaludibacter sp.]